MITTSDRSAASRLVRAAFGLLAVLASFGTASAQQPAPWRHGVLEAKSDAGFVFMASKGGFMEKQGLKVEMMQFKGDAIALKALISGELDTYEGSPGGPMLAASNGADIKLVRCSFPMAPYGSFPKRAHREPPRS